MGGRLGKVRSDLAADLDRFGETPLPFFDQRERTISSRR